MKTFAVDERTLRKLAHDRGFASLAHLARVAGVHRNTLRKYLRGGASPFARAVDQLAHALEVTPLDLIGGRSTADRSDPQQVLVSVLDTIAENETGVVFVLIGSRASGRNRPYSDFDLAVGGGPQHRLESSDYFRIRARLDDALEDFPFSVDLVNMDSAPDWFLAGLGLPVYLSGDRQSYTYFLGVLDGFRKSRAAGHRRRAS